MTSLLSYDRCHHCYCIAGIGVRLGNMLAIAGHYDVGLTFFSEAMYYSIVLQILCSNAL